MTDIMDIFHGHAFDEIMEMDLFEPSYSFVDSFLQPPVIKCCALTKEPTADTRCLSVESDSPDSSVNATIIESSSCHHRGDIFEDYDILPAILGTGHYGCVRECLHKATGEKYAVKTIDKSRVSRLDHIRREIELLSSVDHPRIMKMVDCYEDADTVHIVTERYTGGELFDRIVDNTSDYGCLPEHQAVEIIKSLLEAVQYLHSKDIVHRDIKPENVLFESNEEGSTSIKLIDFGLSRRHGPADANMSNGVGTPYYMSPAILRGEYDRSCDLWAVGVVTYVLLCGYPPFNGSNDREIQKSILEGKLVFDQDVWGNLSRASRDFVSNLLCTDSSKIGTASAALRHPWMGNA